MTIVPTSSSPVGLEDFQPDQDMNQSFTRVSIGTDDDTQQIQFLSKSESWTPSSNLNVIILGLIKQRVLWHHDQDSDFTEPLCRSFDFVQGHPHLVNFEFDDFQPGVDISALDSTDPVVSCSNCSAKEWDSHPTRKIPYCSEQHVMPSLMIDEDGDEKLILLTFQRSGLKSAKAYQSMFHSKKIPMFRFVTKLSIDLLKNGNVRYGVPKFARSDETDEENFAHYEHSYIAVRSILSTPPTSNIAEVEIVDSNTRPEVQVEVDSGNDQAVPF